jgi:multicopper oxidase
VGIKIACPVVKDTVVIGPTQKMNIAWVSDNPGLWAFHCHNLYHQVTGMMRAEAA